MTYLADLALRALELAGGLALAAFGVLAWLLMATQRMREDADWRLERALEARRRRERRR